MSAPVADVEDLGDPSGRQSVRDLEAALGVVGRPLDSYQSILDLGCGRGRMQHSLRERAPAASLHAVDTDAEAVAWMEATVPWVSARVSPALPPLDYPDGSFDLVYSHGFFSHLDEDLQDRWLAEVHRVTRPGGHIVLTVNGEEALLAFERAHRAGPAPVRSELGRRGISAVSDGDGRGGPFPGWHDSTFHAPWYVYEHWGRHFLVAGHLPRRALGFQDLVVLVRPPPGGFPGGFRRPVRVATGEAATEVESWLPALERARALIGGELPAGSRPAATGSWARAVARLRRHQGEHERDVERRLLAAVEELDNLAAARTTVNGVALPQHHAATEARLRAQADQLDGMEQRFRGALARLAARLDRPSGPLDHQ